MKLLWVTHHLESDVNLGDEWLQGGFRGGAEMSDYEYLQHAPSDVEVWRIPPSDLDSVDVDLFDRVLITGTDWLDESQMIYLSTFAPMVFVHHAQTRSAGRQKLLESAEPFVCHTPAHLALETQWCDFNNSDLVLSAFDPDECWIDHKERFVLWAARNHPLKGKNQSALWASKNDLPFLAVSDVDREEVLSLMAVAEWFVHLPLAFESECRSVMEAVLSGCKVHVNDLVGITSYERWNDAGWLADEIVDAGEKFWGLVCR